MRLLILITFLLTSCAQAELKQARKFGEDLKNIVVQNDKEAFLSLPCFPINCVDSDDVDYVFGSSNAESFIKSFLSESSVNLKVFGPYAHDGSSKGASFILMYYKPDLVTFNSAGHLSEVDRKNLWWKGYVETVVHVKDGVWGFKETPFYNGAHLPWTIDY